MKILSVEGPKVLAQLDKQEKMLMIGLPGLHDKVVVYNPHPLSLFEEMTHEVWATVTALFGGYLHPKWLAGPIGLVQAIQIQWAVGAKEVLFWLGIISLGLGLTNLLPLPVLDGGYILLFLLRDHFWKADQGKDTGENCDSLCHSPDRALCLFNLPRRKSTLTSIYFFII